MRVLKATVLACLAGALVNRSPGRVRGCLVELEPRNADAARANLASAGLSRVDVICADAALTDRYADYAPADLVLVCGVFGNISDRDIEQTIASLPMLCASGATVVWTRHRRPPDATPAIRGRLAEAQFEELSFDAPAGPHYSVGTHRYDGAPVALEPGIRLFEFVR